MRTASILLLASVLAAGDAVAPVTLPALPSSVSRSSNLWFEDGKLTGGQDGLQIGLVAKLGERLRIVEIESVELVEAIGDDGKAMQQHEHDSSGGGGGEPGQLDVSITLNPPSAGVKSLRSLVVSARVRVAAEGLRRTALKPAKEWIAKRMRIDGLAGAEVELENLGADTLTLGMTPALERAIENLTCKNAAGDELEQHGTNDNQEPGWIARVIQVALPADGSIILELRQELGVRSFILRASNVPICLPDRNKVPVGVLKTEEVKGADEGGAIEAVPLPAIKPGF